MTRVSLREAYDNKDVVAQIYAIRDTAESAEDTAEQAVTTANTASDHVDALVPQVEGAVQNANSASASAQASAQTVAGYENRLGAVEGDVVQLNTDVDGVESDLNAVTLRVTTAEGDIVTIQGRVTALETADGQNVKINNIDAYAVGLTGNQPDILGRKGFKGTVDFTATASYSTDDFVSTLVKTIYSNTDADNTILEERQVIKETADTLRFDTRNRMSKDGTSSNRIDTYLRTVINETTETVTLQLFILVYENNVQVRGKSMTIATLSAA